MKKHSYSFLQDTRSLFEYYKGLGERTFQQLPDEGLFYSPSEGSLDIATIVQHLSGNMLSRWTDFLTSDGEKEWRHRDAEFETGSIGSRAHLIQVWEKGWECLLDTMHKLTEEDLEREIYIRGEAHNVRQAIHRQLTHYAYHIGQIVYLGKLFSKTSWKSLSIPLKGSKKFNEDMKYS